MRRLFSISATLLALTISPASGAAVGDTSASVHWKPSSGVTFQWQLQGDIDTSYEADVYDIDMFDSPKSVIAELHAQDRHVVCYISAGSYEKWRPDKDKFPRKVLGEPLDNWPGERWLDIRRLDVLKPIMKARIRKCDRKGFDGIEFDNVDAYTYKARATGFDLNKQDELDYLAFLSRFAHKRGLAAGLKNLPQLGEELEPKWDFVVNEQCFQYEECEEYLAFIDADKPVFNVEYELEVEEFCPQANEWGFTSQRKDYDLFAPREACWEL
jgi:hypothetical protein